MIRNINTLRKYEGGEDITNMNVLKARVKKHLKQLGVEFDREKRFRAFGRCDKGYSMEQHLIKMKQEKLQKENQ
jgi:hypothetical protein